MTELETVAIAVAQEEKSLQDLGKIYTNFRPRPRFPLVADIGYKKTAAYDRVSAYLIDKQGKVAQVFDSMVHFRPPLTALLHEVRALQARQNQTASAAGD